MAFIYTCLQFVQTFLELNLFQSPCQAHKASQDLPVCLALLFIQFRSSSPKMFCKEDVLKYFVKFTRNNQWENLRKLQVSKLPVKKETPARVFSEEF